MIFARKIPDVFIIIARKIFSRIFGGGVATPLPPSPMPDFFWGGVADCTTNMCYLLVADCVGISGYLGGGGRGALPLPYTPMDSGCGTSVSPRPLSLCSRPTSKRWATLLVILYRLKERSQVK